MKGIFRGQCLGMAKAIVSLSLFHEGRLFLTKETKIYNSIWNIITKIYKFQKKS